MADSAPPPAAASTPAPALVASKTNANTNTNDKNPNGGGNRNNSNNGRSKRGPPNRQGSVNNSGANGNAQPKDNTIGTGTNNASSNSNTNANSGAKFQNRPPKKNTAKEGTSPAPVPQLAAAVASDASRPSSTDGTKKNDNRRSGPRRESQSVGRGQGNNRRGSNRQASQSRQQSGEQTKASPATENSASTPSATAQEQAGPGQRLLERAITDMKALPSGQAAPQQQNSSAPAPAAAAPQQIPTAQSSTLGLNAPVFQPGASVYPTPGAPTDLPPRHRKSASTGSHSTPGSFSSPSFASPLQNFSPNLHSMREDVAEEGEIDENGNPYHQQQQQPQFQQRNVQPPAGAFSAPRFAALAQQQQQGQAIQEDPEVLGPTGRPQLAPSFQFGARRRTNTNPATGPALPEGDLGFQFPQQQHYQPESQTQQPQQSLGQAQPQAHRRTGSEVSGMLAEQVHAYIHLPALEYY
jgi:protein SSD1